GASTPSDITESLTSFQKSMGPLSSYAHLKGPANGLSHQMDNVPSVGLSANTGGTNKGQLARGPAAKHVRTQPLQQVSGLYYISPQDLASKLTSRKGNSGLTDSVGLVIDMRKSADYMSARIAGAVSMTAPTTLVKRRTFTVERLLGMLRVTEEQKKWMADWKLAPWVVLYGEGSPEETATEDTSLVMLTRKFMTEAPESCQVFVLQGGFTDFSAQQSELCELGSDIAVDLPLSLSLGDAANHQSLTNSSSSPSIGSGGGGRSLVNGPMMSMPLSSASVLPPVLLTGNTPLTIDTAGSGRVNFSSTLDRPSIVKPKPTVDVNHPMLRTMRQTPGGGFDPSEVIPLRLPPNLPLSQKQGARGSKEATRYLLELPVYLRRAADPNTGPQLLNRLFKCIDASENRRMSSMIGSNGMVTKYNQYTISAGLELGSKNRYTTVFPFDNNRVRLRSMRRRPQSTDVGCCADKNTAAGTPNKAIGESGRPMSLGHNSKGLKGQMVADGLSPPVDGNAAEPMVVSSRVDDSAAAAYVDEGSPGGSGSDYVNASYISYFDGPL
ncbi:phosphotyrosine-specific ptp2-like protein, partial [Coemansia erecta]